MAELYDAKLETMSPDVRSKYNDERVRWVINYAYDNAPAMREKMDRAGIAPSQIQGVKDLELIPVTKKDDVIRLQRENPPFGGMIGVPLSELRGIFISPGPIYDAVGDEAYTRLGKIFYAAGFRKEDVVLNTFSYHLVPAGLLMHEAVNALGARVLPTGVGNTELQIQIMRDIKVTAYLGTPSFLMTLIHRAEGLGYNFQTEFCLNKAFLGGEMLPQSLRDSFEKEYGISAFQAYGVADIGPLAYECVQKSGMHIPEEMIVEIVDPSSGKQLPPGEIGEVVVTAIERTHPLIRFGTGDLALITEESCLCGRTSPRLVRIVGRVGEAAKVRGMFLHPDELQEAVKAFPEVACCQAVISRKGVRDELTLKVELSNANVDAISLKDAIAQSVTSSCRVKCDSVEFVLRETISGDDRLIVDERKWE